MFQTFDLNSSTADWARFSSRAALVKKLSHDESRPKGGHKSLISPQAIAELAFGASTREDSLLPRVRSIVWIAQSDSTVTQLLAFISADLQELNVKLQSPTMHVTAPRMFFLLSHRLKITKLWSLKLTTTYSNDDGLRAFGKCLDQCPELRALDLWGLRPNSNISGHLPVMKELRSLTVKPRFTEPDTVYGFIGSITTSFPSLLTILMVIRPDAIADTTLPWRIFLPLLSLSTLISLEIRHDKAILLSPNDIAGMGKAWPAMKTLSLGAAAVQEIEGVGTPLTLLTDFASSLHNLERLAIHFSYDQELPTADIMWTSFNRLKVLSGGASKIPQDKVRAIAEFILGVCPPGVKLACYCVSPGNNTFDVTAWLQSPSRTTLKEVKDLMGFSMRMQIRWLRRLSKGSQSEVP